MKAIAILAMLTFAFSTATVSAAIRRRAVRVPAPANSTCVTIAPLRAGLVASYTSTITPNIIQESSVTYVTDSAVQTTTTEHTSLLNTIRDTTMMTEYGDSSAVFSLVLRTVKHLMIDSTAMNSHTTINTSYVPSRLAEPLAEWCAGATWHGSTTQTTVTTNPGQADSTRVTTLQEQGQILAVNEVVTTAAGTFSTVKWRVVSTAGAGEASSVIRWTSIPKGIPVREEAYNGAGALAVSTVLTSLR